MIAVNGVIILYLRIYVIEDYRFTELINGQ